MDQREFELMAKQFGEVIGEIELKYVESWARMATFYESLGIYDDIAKFMGIKSGQVWVDLCSGTANLISGVRSTSEPTSVGIDFNPHSLRLAAKRLQEEGHRINLSGTYSMSVSGHPFSYRRVPEMQKGYRLVDGEINLLMDDIRTLDILKQYLDGRRVDITTFTFCGVSRASWFEGDYVLDSSDLLQDFGKELGAETIKRNEEVNATVRKAAFAQSAALLKPGGQLIYVDRMKVDGEETPFQAYGRAFGKLPLAHLESVKQQISQPTLDDHLGIAITGTRDVPKTFDVVFSRFEYAGNKN